MQQTFLADVIKKECHTELYQPSVNFSADKLLQVYQNNYQSTPFSALKATYSCIYRLVGDGFFHFLAQTYIKTHTIDSGNIQDYGAGFADLIKQLKECKQLGYLSDIARLEFYYEKCYYGQNIELNLVDNHPNFDKIPKKALQKCLTASYLLKSDYPLIKIWQLNENSPTLNLKKGKDNILIYKYNNKVKVMRLEAKIFQFLQEHISNDVLVN